VSAALTDADGATVTIDVVDNQDGSYTLKYKVKSKLDHKLEVYVQGHPIQDSPFTVSVSTGIDMLKIGPVLTWFGSHGVETNTKLNETYEPWGICCDADDNIVVTDHNNHKIQVNILPLLSMNYFL